MGRPALAVSQVINVTFFLIPASITDRQRPGVACGERRQARKGQVSLAGNA